MYFRYWSKFGMLMSLRSIAGDTYVAVIWIRFEFIILKLIDLREMVGK